MRRHAAGAKREWRAGAVVEQLTAAEQRMVRQALELLERLVLA